MAINQELEGREEASPMESWRRSAADKGNSYGIGVSPVGLRQTQRQGGWSMRGVKCGCTDFSFSPVKEEIIGRFWEKSGGI